MIEYIFKELKLKFDRSPFKFILSIILFIIFIYFVLLFIKFIKAFIFHRSNEEESAYNYIINCVYEKNKSYFKFDENNEFIISIEDFMKLDHNNPACGVPAYSDKDLDLCYGYLILKNNNGIIDIDESHICD